MVSIGGVDWIVAITIVGTLCSILFGYIGYQKGKKKEHYQEGALLQNIEYIKNRTDDTLLEQKDTNKKIDGLTERVTRVEESTKQAHKRIDTFEKKG